jgi:DNA-binding SARP family transcriptional activator
MTSLTIRLLGPPSVEEGGSARAPCGSKTWALLAFLLLAQRPPSRSRLADLFFPEAEDPRAALRWSLADLRTLLGPGTAVGGDPVALRLPDDSAVDLWTVTTASPSPPDVTVLDGELLEGLQFPSSAPLELWLTCERRRLSVRCRELLASAADEATRDGDIATRAGLEARLVVLDPFVAVGT